MLKIAGRIYTPHQILDPLQKETKRLRVGRWRVLPVNLYFNIVGKFCSVHVWLIGNHIAVFVAPQCQIISTEIRFILGTSEGAEQSTWEIQGQA